MVATGIAGLTAASQLGAFGNALRSPGYVHLAQACVVALLVVLVYTFLHRRANWWTVPLVPALVTIAGSGLKDVIATISFSLAGLIILSLYGSMRMWLTRVVLALAAVPAAVAISPSTVGRPVSWHSGTVLNLLPQIVLMAVMTRGIYLALQRQERAALREAALARAGHSMIGCTDFAEVRTIGGRVAGELVTLSPPGTALLVVRRDADGLYVANLAGVPERLRGRRLPVGFLADGSGLRELVPGTPHWRIDDLGVETGDVFIAVGGPRPVGDDVVDAFRTLSHQVLLAERSCRVYAELDHLAHHDHLTQLPTRAKFFRTLDDALDTPSSATVALINVDLDDFKQVNDRYGHAAGDELLVAVASRLNEVARGHGMAGRFGGDEFAVLFTGLVDANEAFRVAERLSARLTEPVTLTAATITPTTITPGASIGVATAEPGITGAELTRRADVAMYEAKHAGKNQVQSFPPVRHLVA